MLHGRRVYGRCTGLATRNARLLRRHTEQTARCVACLCVCVAAALSTRYACAQTETFFHRYYKSVDVAVVSYFEQGVLTSR